MLTTTRSLLPNSLRTLAGAALLCLAGTAAAMPVSEYGLIVLENLEASVKVGSNTFVGGNVTGNHADFGRSLDRSTQGRSAEIAGNLNGTITVGAGYVAVGGNDHTSNLNCNGNGFGQGRCLQLDSSLQSRALDLKNQLYDDTLNISRLDSNGEVVSQGNSRILHYSGSESVAVFELSGETLFKQNSNWSLAAGDAETVIINVSGKAIGHGGGVHFSQGFGAGSDSINVGASNILWNFHEAESIDFGNTVFTGSVLAYNAAIANLNHLYGSLAVTSYARGDNGQIHNYHFNGIDLPSSPTAPAVAVSEPPLWTMLLLGAGLLVMGLRRRMRTA